jgi:hypothetical protein
MTDAPHNDHERFEWLEAGRALGDLTSDEYKEWKKLSAKYGSDQASGMDYAALVGTLEREFTSSELMPVMVKSAVIEAATVSDKKVVTQGPWVQRFGGWALAACVAVLAVILFVQKNDLPNGKTLLAEVQRQKDVVRVEFQGDDKYPGVTGQAYWSDHLQNGVIVLQGLPANEPLRSQYQLWIVDKNRDLYLTPVQGAQELYKLHIMVDSVAWNTETDALAAVSDGQMLVWFYPEVVYMDRELLPLTLSKQSGDWGKTAEIVEFRDTRTQVRRSDGSIVCAGVSPYHPFSSASAPPRSGSLPSASAATLSQLSCGRA